MLTKILFTVLVIIGVAIFYRHKAAAADAGRAKSAAQRDAAQDDVLPVRRLAYIMIGVLIAIAILVFAYNWHQNNRIVNIRVTAESGEVTTYQARHSEIKGRSFTSLTGVEVTLGESDRVEMLQQ